MKLQKWEDVYPQGTREGDEETLFFIALQNSKKSCWRTVKSISTDTGLSFEKIEKIINKYYKLGMIIPDPKNESNWGYWENVPKEYWPKKKESLVERDHKERMKKVNPNISDYQV